jgi:hypothetical protein
MKIKDEIIKKIRENADIRRELLYRMEWSEPTLYRLLRENAVNGDLTKIFVLRIVATGLGVPEVDIIEGANIQIFKNSNFGELE